MLKQAQFVKTLDISIVDAQNMILINKDYL